ncbi:winged helix-turn-helix domain-containing protein [Haladaptatus pallidirubidus]|uniref:HTH arsR-type domain-containing protein n=1 Tax=Haladaptatus pallidirubidus TaxID=1008152 RepID=A0AAV3UIH8_9EURY|nr:helix-turn-helix domain-containing protein [Haladaptatus pallidirubidus]
MSEIDTKQAGDIQILGIDEQDTDAVFETLLFETARKLLVAINDEPGTSEFADRLGTSIQTVSYHLIRLVNHRHPRNYKKYLYGSLIFNGHV